MMDGLYKVRFESPGQRGSCICLCKGGNLYGGGNILYYVGTCLDHDGHLVGELTAKRHARSEQGESPLGLDCFTMLLDGIISGGYGQARCTVKERPGLVMLASFLQVQAL